MSLLDIDENSSTIKSEILELLKNIEEERTEYQENKIIKEVAYECVNNSEINARLVNKVNNILMDSEIVKSIEVVPRKNLLVNSILSNDISLELEEGDILNNEVNKKLENKEKEMIEELLQIGLDIRSEIVKSDLCNFEKDQTEELINLKCVFEDIRGSYIECLEKLMSVYEEILKLKFESLPCVINDKAEILQTETDTMRLKAEMLQAKAKVNVFTETNRSLQAYEEILKDIQQEKAECKEELEKLQQQKENYKQVSSKEYNEILEKYIACKAKFDSLK